MDNLINKDYFIGLNKITGLNESEPDREEQLNLLISQYQPEFLERFFGSTITLTAESELIPFIRNEETKTSPLANYIYCIYQENQAALTTNAGDKKINIQNTSVADYRNKVVKSWNNMVIQNQKIHDKLYQLQTIGTVSYINDILYNMGVYVEYVVNDNQTNGIILKGGIFSTKTIYDYNK